MFAVQIQSNAICRASNVRAYSFVYDSDLKNANKIKIEYFHTSDISSFNTMAIERLNNIKQK